MNVTTNGLTAHIHDGSAHVATVHTGDKEGSKALAERFVEGVAELNRQADSRAELARLLNKDVPRYGRTAADFEHYFLDHPFLDSHRDPARFDDVLARMPEPQVTIESAPWNGEIQRLWEKAVTEAGQEQNLDHPLVNGDTVAADAPRRRDSIHFDGSAIWLGIDHGDGSDDVSGFSIFDGDTLLGSGPTIREAIIATGRTLSPPEIWTPASTMAQIAISKEDLAKVQADGVQVVRRYEASLWSAAATLTPPEVRAVFLPDPLMESAVAALRLSLTLAQHRLLFEGEGTKQTRKAVETMGLVDSEGELTALGRLVVGEKS